MKKISRFVLAFFFLAGFHSAAFAFKPGKPGTGFGSTSGSGTNTNSGEVKLPITLPLEFSDAPSQPSTPSGTAPSGNGKIVYTFELNDEIGPQSVHQAHSALQQARAMNASFVLIHMSSYAGAMDAAMGIRDEILEYDRPVMMYYDNKIIPAGTLISRACDSVYVRKSSVSGARQAVKIIQKDSQKNKVSIAQMRPMTDGQLNLASATVSKNNSQSVEASSMDDVLAHAGLNNYTVVHYKAAFSDRLIDWLMQPWVSLLLIMLIAFSLRAQQNSPFPGPATFMLMVALPLFLIPLYMGGLAKASEIILLIITSALFIFVKTKIRWIQFLLPVSIAAVFTLCLTENIFTDHFTAYAILLRTVFSSAAAFLAGWYSLPFFGKIFTQKISARVLQG